MKVFDSKQGQLPKNNEYVIGRCVRGTWFDDDDQEGCVWVVVKFERGLSAGDRKSLVISDKQRKSYSQCDESHPNTKPYGWNPFGPDYFKGQDIDLWCRLPRVKSFEGLPGEFLEPKERKYL